MGLGLGQVLRQVLGLTCTVCDQLKRSDRDDLAEGLLFGLKDPYSLCPSCKQKPPNPEDEEYRRRARVHYFTVYGRILRVP